MRIPSRPIWSHLIWLTAEVNDAKGSSRGSQVRKFSVGCSVRVFSLFVRVQCTLSRLYKGGVPWFKTTIWNLLLYKRRVQHSVCCVYASEFKMRIVREAAGVTKPERNSKYQLVPEAVNQFRRLHLVVNLTRIHNLALVELEIILWSSAPPLWLDVDYFGWFMEIVSRKA